MSDEPIPSDDWDGTRCPVCGGELAGFDPESSCAGVRCTSCDYAVVTTNQNIPPNDPTPYTVWIAPGNVDRRRLISLIASRLFFGSKAAREIVDDHLPVRGGILATEVIQLTGTLRHLGLDYRIEPPFPWRLPAQASSPGQPPNSPLPEVPLGG